MPHEPRRPAARRARSAAALRRDMPALHRPDKHRPHQARYAPARDRPRGRAVRGITGHRGQGPGAAGINRMGTARTRTPLPGTQAGEDSMTASDDAEKIEAVINHMTGALAHLDKTLTRYAKKGANARLARETRDRLRRIG